MESGKRSCFVRSASAQDLPAMVGLLQELFAIEADFQGDPDTQERGLRLLLAQPGARIWVAEDGGRVVGMCTLQVLISTAEGGPVGLIEDLVVMGEFRNAGIGRMLLETAEAWAVEQGLSRLQLLADIGNGRALGFYERMGWKPTQLVGLRRKLRG